MAGQEPARLDARTLGAQTAEQIIAMQAGAGMTSDRMRDVHGDIATSLLADASTDDGRAFAGGYLDTALVLITDLADLEWPDLEAGS